jgi:hypothetical protein
MYMLMCGPRVRRQVVQLGEAQGEGIDAPGGPNRRLLNKVGGAYTSCPLPIVVHHPLLHCFSMALIRFRFGSGSRSPRLCDLQCIGAELVAGKKALRPVPKQVGASGQQLGPLAHQSENSRFEEQSLYLASAIAARRRYTSAQSPESSFSDTP